jgi:hypothetical protein
VAEFIPKDQCIERRLYRIRSRNLLYGVYRAETGGFLGIREKFGSVYVFEEYHYDNGPPYGTVQPLEDLGADLPENIRLSENLPGTWNRERTREVEWRPDEPEGKVGKWYFKGTDEVHLGGGCVHDNKPLFDWLMEQEKNDAPWVIETENEKLNERHQLESVDAYMLNRLTGERIDLGTFENVGPAHWDNRELLDQKNKEHREAQAGGSL